jgi:pyruvate ferredoxin oxidoreductase alpha subunit
MLDGNGAASVAMRLARIGVVSAYPITPQSPISEVLSEYVAEGTLDAQYVRVESEHTAMSVAIGAQLTGVRTGTATSSVGLALMFEMLGMAAGLRLPIVMPVVNRALVAPWSLWCDHQDAMSARDLGWMQLYAEDCQEVLDLILIAYKAAEHGDVLLPAMVCLDGFFLSHMSQAVIVPDQKSVDVFLPPYEAKNLKLDLNDPMFINNLTPSSEFMEMRYQQFQGFEKAYPVLNETMKDFGQQFGRDYQLLEAYCCEDADAVLITLGSMSGSVKHIVDQYRSQGKKVGNIRIVSFRPFPADDLAAMIPPNAGVGVLDRSMSMGSPAGPVCMEVRSAIADARHDVIVQPYVVGLGGRDVTPVAITTAFDQLLEKNLTPKVRWLDVSDRAMEVRQYMEVA